jgi:large subunit ribosomal protein L25
MKKVSLSGSERSSVGTKDAKLLRREDLVPCVMYGGKEQKHFVIPRLALNKFIYTPEVFEIELEVAGSTHRTILKEVQFHPINDKPIHADFMELTDGKLVKVELPVKLVGNSIGVKNGGKLMQHFRKIKVKAVPADIPELITINIEKLRIGFKIRIGDVSSQYPNLEFLHPTQAVLVGIKTARGAVDENEEAGEGEEAATEEATAEA